MKTKIILLIAAIILVSCKEETPDSILLLGMNSDHQIEKRFMPKEMFSKTLGHLLNNSSQNIVNEINSLNLDKQNSSSWKLNQVSVGLEFSFGAELAELFDLEVAPAIELKFGPVPQENL